MGAKRERRLNKIPTTTTASMTTSAASSERVAIPPDGPVLIAWRRAARGPPRRHGEEREAGADDAAGHHPDRKHLDEDDGDDDDDDDEGVAVAARFLTSADGRPGSGAGVDEAVRLLLLRDDGDGGESNRPPEAGAAAATSASAALSACLRLIGELRSTTTVAVGGQLRSLREFRSSLLRLPQPPVRGDDDGHDHDGDDDDAEAAASPSDREVVTGTYRLLLELGLSPGAPHPMRRAARSCLSTLGEVTATAAAATSVDDAAFEEAITIDAVKSVLLLPDGTTQDPGAPLVRSNRYWSDPVRSLFEVMAYGPTADALLSPHPSIVAGDEGGDGLALVADALRLLLDAASAVRPVLSRYPLTIPGDGGTGGGGADDGMASSLSSAGAEAGGAASRAADVATSLRSILVPLLRGRLRRGLRGRTSGNLELGGEGTAAEVAASNAVAAEAASLLASLESSLLLPMLRCAACMAEHLSLAGVTLAQCALARWTLEAEGFGVDGESVAARVVPLLRELTHPRPWSQAVDGELTPKGRRDAGDGRHEVGDWRGLPPLSALAVVRGLVASLPDGALAHPVPAPPPPAEAALGRGDDRSPRDESSTTSSVPPERSTPTSILCGPLASRLLTEARSGTDPAARLSALRGLDGWITRAASAIEARPTSSQADDDEDKDADEDDDDDSSRSGGGGPGESSQFRADVSRLARGDLMDAVMESWECPTSRQVAAVVPGVFENLVRLLLLTRTTVTVAEAGAEVEVEVEAEVVSESGATGATGEVGGDSARLIERERERQSGGEKASKEREGDATFRVVAPVLRRVLAQPLNRKGRYEALDVLLPIVGARTLLEAAGAATDGGPGAGAAASDHPAPPGPSSSSPSSSSSPPPSLIPSLVRGVGEPPGGSAGAIAELLGKLLRRLLDEMCEVEGIDRVGSGKVENRKDRRRRMRRARARARAGKDDAADSSQRAEDDDGPSNLPAEWFDCWTPSFAAGLLSRSARRRNQVAAHCLPLLLPMCSGNRAEAALAYAALLDELDGQYGADVSISSSVTSYGHYLSGSGDNPLDNHLWASLEVVQYAASQRIVSSSPSLRRSIAMRLPESTLKAALIHSRSWIRLAGFSAMDALVSTYEGGEATRLSKKLNLWVEALPYANKSGEKEYTSKLLQHITSFMRELAAFEEDRPCSEEVPSWFRFFVCDFLILDVSLKQGMYPGSAFEKEAFALALLRCTFAFATTSNKTVKTEPMDTRGKVENEKRKQQHIVDVLLSAETFASLLTLLHSMWDRTRMTAYNLMRDIIRHALSSELLLPLVLTERDGRKTMESRAVHLASSPRQRESDTGARMLALLYMSTPPPVSCRRSFLDSLLALLGDRVDKMESALGVVVPVRNVEQTQPTNSSEPKSSSFVAEADDDMEQSGGPILPLAHGLLYALRLVVDVAANEPVFSFIPHGTNEPRNGVVVDELFEAMAGICCRSVSLSLSVVADMKNDDDDEDCLQYETGGFESLTTDNMANGVASGVPRGSTPLNVNTGALGANTSSDADTQRVVIGSWLLTKEGCAALSTVIRFTPNPSVKLLGDAGSLLLATLIGLKHQGGAFAAHNALQELSERCLAGDSDTASILKVPSMWVRYLLEAISKKEMVRNSTLRRSTGYALGFLSVMRTEPLPRTICPFVLASLLKLSLPSKSRVEQRLRQLGLYAEFTYATNPAVCKPWCYVDDEDYQWRCRVHALNVLRLCIVDAPLASDIIHFVGDAIMAAIIGYDDDDWAVRNSSTMVFASAMLRIVDANKNASSASKGDTSKATGITARELFRSFPSLRRFLVAVVKEGLNDLHTNQVGRSASDQPKSQEALSRSLLRPSLYPILLLLSRLQPAEATVADFGANDAIRPFIPLVLQCLEHWHHKVRLMAARALASLSCGDSNQSDVSSRSSLLSHCMGILGKSMNLDPTTQQFSWNACHGALLGVRALANSSPNPMSVLTSSLTILSYFASWCNGYCLCPPSCSAVALEVLADVTTKNDIQHNIVSEAASAALEKSELLVKLNYDPPVGLPYLSSTAATILCRSSIDMVLDHESNGAMRSMHLARIRRLFRSASFDVRWAAVKAFKKHFHTSTKSFIYNVMIDKGLRAKVMSHLSRTLHDALLDEWKRQFSKDPLGAHPPTLRRLSRCFIESLAGCSVVGGATCYSEGYSKEEWDMLVCMRLSGATMKGGKANNLRVEKGGTSLSGNSMELMAFALCQSGGAIAAEIEIASRIECFADAIVESMNRRSSLATRHSAALAISSFNATTCWMAPILDSARSSRVQLLLTTLRLLQDNDEDVRITAGKAAGMVEPKPVPDHVIAASKARSASVSLFALEQMSTIMLDCGNGADVAAGLMEIIEKSCAGVEENIELLLTEFAYSKNQSQSLNLSGTRRIFEEEEPSVFEEKLVVTQLAAAVLLSSGYQGKINGSDSIVERCNAVLKLLENQMKIAEGNDIVYELTRCGQVFPGLHGLLLGSMCCILLGCHVDTPVSENAGIFLKTLATKNANVSRVHPCIVQAIIVLWDARHPKFDTRAGSLRCCFLLPSMVKRQP